jgi:hypothetical protein
MPIGAGKYDELCTYVRSETRAIGAIVMVLDGNKGSGFSVQADLETTMQLPALLRQTADQIEASFKKGKM